MRDCAADKRSWFIQIIDSLLGQPKMQPRDRSNRLLGGVQDGATGRNGQLCSNEALGWI
jgi:hypothetical protein